MLLVSGATKTIARIGRPDRIGALLVPRAGNRAPTDRPFALDNDAFKGFKEAAFLRMLERHVDRAREALWCCAPDVVGDADATRALFEQWSPRIRAAGYPVAYVLQDGETPERCPWDALDAAFVGGTDEFKLSPEARELVREAKRRGKRAHMGRVNSRCRLRIAAEWGCDSVDGTSFSKFSDTWIPWAIRYLDNLDRQEAMPW